MKTVAIICEYNPFHTGHEYQINEIRREFGEDTVIIALMSGNFTQRGEIAILDKSARAKIAVDCGADLCLELPFPYSMSSAEVFARGAVNILNSLGTVDYLSFGSECGDIDPLIKCAEAMLSAEYERAIKRLLASKENKELGYPRLCEIALTEVSDSEVASIAALPNNILAIEYIKALISQKSNIIPHTIKRSGAGYNEEKMGNFEHQSASAIRRSILNGDYSALEYVPICCKETILSELELGNAPCLDTSLSTSVISRFRLSSSTDWESLPDASGGLYNRLRALSFEANSLAELIAMAETKKYTTARLRRAIWYYYFSVTSSEISAPCAYTQVLALNAKGSALLKRVKRTSSFPIITKPSATKKLSEDALSQKRRSDRADSIFQLTKPKAPSGCYALTVSPYIK